MLLRIFKDQFRCFNILGLDYDEKTVHRFEKFLSKEENEKRLYHQYLWLKASRLHYSLELNNYILRNEYVDSADKYYTLALSSEYSDFNTKSTTIIKQTDLSMCYYDFSEDITKDKINHFIYFDEMNAVDVHIAYGLTILAKMLILSKKNLSNTHGILYSNENDKIIRAHLKNAFSIYSRFGNKYGSFRVMLIKCLYKLYIAKVTDETKCIDRIKELHSSNKNYEREKKFAVQL